MRRFGIGWGMGIVLLLTTLIALSIYVGKNAGLARADGIKELFRTMGFSALPANSESAGSQSSLDGVCSCLQDAPGGYCYKNNDTGTEHIPFAESDYLILEVK